MADPAGFEVPGTTRVWTDGACIGNPGPGGWAWAVPGERYAAGYERGTTNQRMELTAAAEAIEAFAGPVEVITDSTYVKNCFTQRWYQRWMANDWRNSRKQPVANKDLWKPLIEAYLARPGEITFTWVKGHSGDSGNDLVDRLAVRAAHRQKPVSGTGDPPTDALGAPDEVHGPGPADAGSGSATVGAPADPRVPAGHPVAVFGLRPPELGGWEPNPIADEVRRRLAEILAAKAELNPDQVVLTGVRLGAEMLAAEAAVARGLRWVAVLAHPDPVATWSAANRAHFDELCARAEAVVTLERKTPKTRDDRAKALARRDGWMRAASGEAILVWDHEHKSLRDAHRRLVKRFGDDLWVIEPDPWGDG